MNQQENQQSADKLKPEVVDSKEIKQELPAKPPVANFIKIGTLNIYHNLPPRLQKRYQQKLPHLWWDLLFILLIILLLGFNLFLLYGGNTNFSLQVANRKVIEIKRQESTENNNQQSTTTPAEIKKDSNLEISGLARYFTLEGDQLGRGPLPPKVGQETSYWIFWQIENNPNPLTEVTVSGILPANVSFSGRFSVSAGEAITYDPQTRKVVWLVGDLASGQSIVQASFEVSLKPTVDQLSQVPLLVQNSYVQAHDLLTGNELKKSTANITAQIISTETGKNLGLVVE